MAWILAQEKVSTTKACIIGASYGCYVALTAAFQQVNRFDCAISIAGVSDVKKLVRNNDNHGFYTDHIAPMGDKKATDELVNVSSINYIKKLEPLFY